MPSPFPGMNPYLEHPELWRDFHESAIPAMRDSIAQEVRPKYFVRIEEHVYVEDVDFGTRTFLGLPDVAVAKPRDTTTAASGNAAVLECPMPVAIESPTPERLSYLEVRDRQSNRIVTVIELLSPTNKGNGRGEYLSKRDGVYRSDAHLVEIDLLRGGIRPPLVEPLACDYCVIVSQAETRPHAASWPWRLRDPMPTIPIPLAQPDPPAQLSLKAVLDRVYDGAGYEDYIYRFAIDPPLTAADAEWAKQFAPIAGV